MFRILDFWLLKTSIIFLLSMKKKIQLINHFKTLFYFMMCVNCFCRTLKNASNMLNNSNVIILSFSSHTVWIWLSSNMRAVFINLFWCALICYDSSMSCFLVMMWSQVVIITSIILSMIFSSVMISNY